MNITLNGESKVTQAATIAALVAELSLNTRQVAIERNREIVPRSTYETAVLAEGDVVEIVAFIGGG
jgi:thiamine biosynthesis protein ThiS